MILQSLKDLAKRDKLTADLDYEPRPVAWIVTLDTAGHFLSLVPTTGIPDSKGRSQAKTFSIPRRRTRTGNNLNDFLVDKSDYVLGALPDPEEQRVRAERSEIRRNLFFSEVQAAAAATNSPEIGAIAAFLAFPEARDTCVAELEKAGYASNDLIAFEVDGRLTHELPEARDYFSKQRDHSKEAGCECLICGETRAPIGSHPSIRVRGGSSSGIALVSFNSGAFESFGWAGNRNAPVCRGCAEAYTTGLRRLLSDRYPHPEVPGSTLPQRYVHLTDNTTAIFWGDGDLPPELASIFDAPNENSVKAVLSSPWTGSSPASLRSQFYCLLISGGQGRAILRGVHTGTIERVERNVRTYFEILRAYSDRPLPIIFLLRSLAVLGKIDNIVADVAGSIFLSALFALPIPRNVLSAAVQRCRSEQKVTRERAALLALYFHNQQTRKETHLSLDLNRTDPGYRFGRLLAVLERLQATAQNNPNKTIVDRFYGAASTRPVTVFPSLIHLAQHHASKSSGSFFQKQIADVLDGVQEFPSSLTLEQQGLFALGYYHQRQNYFTKREGTPEQTGNVTEGSSINEQ